MSKYGGNTLLERIMKKVLSGLFFALIIVVLLALVILPILNKYIPGLLGNTSESGVVLTNESMNVEYVDKLGYRVTITGSATNESSKDVPRVTVQYTLFNKEGQEIGSAVGVVENIASDKAVEFTTVTMDFLEEKPHTFKLSKMLLI